MVEGDGDHDGTRKGWTMEEEEHLLRFLTEFESVKGSGRAKKGRSKFEPMADRLNRAFYGKNRLRYPHRTWENLRVKSNNLRSKYDTMRKRFTVAAQPHGPRAGNAGLGGGADRGEMINVPEANKIWPHFEHCHSLFGASPDGKEDANPGDGSPMDDDGEEGTPAPGLVTRGNGALPSKNGGDSEHVNSKDETRAGAKGMAAGGGRAGTEWPVTSSPALAAAAVLTGEPPLDARYSGLIEAIWRVEREWDEKRRDEDRDREHRDRKFQLELEKLKMENRSWLEVELERIRQDHSMRLKELEVKMRLVIQSESTPHSPHPPHPQPLPAKPTLHQTPRSPAQEQG